jgi:hypothetical protein
MRAALSGHNADYVELRVEEIDIIASLQVDVSWRRSGLRPAERLRASLRQRSLGFVTLTRLGDLRTRVERAVRQARLTNGNGGELAERIKGTMYRCKYLRDTQRDPRHWLRGREDDG